jgi:hypothetical protein
LFDFGQKRKLKFEEKLQFKGVTAFEIGFHTAEITKARRFGFLSS